MTRAGRPRQPRSSDPNLRLAADQLAELPKPCPATLAREIGEVLRQGEDELRFAGFERGPRQDTPHGGRYQIRDPHRGPHDSGSVEKAR